jgi:diguanylate cyclase (GGDEF)-like protein
MASWAILLLGSCCSIVGGWQWGSAADSDARQVFGERAAAIARAIDLAWERDIDLTATTRSIIELQPGMGDARLDEWFTALGASQAYPGALGASFIDRVPRSELVNWDKALDSALHVSQAGLPPVVPAGSRPYYCLQSYLAYPNGGADIAPTAALAAYLARLDWCSTPLVAQYDQAAATGEFSAASFPVAQMMGLLVEAGAGRLANGAGEGALARVTNSLVIVAPVYQKDKQGDAKEVLGWVGNIFDPQGIIGASHMSIAHLDVTLGRVGLKGQVTPLVGWQHARGTTPTTDRFNFYADGQWQVDVAGTPVPQGLPGASQGAVIALGGLAVSLLIFLLLRVLVSSRERALLLVDSKTAELLHRALYDPLTDLPNRALVLERAGQLLARAQGGPGLVAMLFIDLDNFKEINDTLGHTAGDQLLQAVAERLSSAVRSTDTVARLGGDEFVVLIDNSAQVVSPARAAGRLLAALREPFHLGRNGAPYRVTASIGIAAGPRDSCDELLRDADVALYQAKAAGKNRFTTFETQMQVAVESRLQLERDLYAAVKDGQFFLVYQPTFDIDSNVPTGVEALLRWQHPSRGVVGPVEFIPVLESTGMIGEVGRWALREACVEVARWRDEGYPISVSVNVSARQLENDSVAGDVTEALSTSGLMAGSLALEITEGVLMKDPEVMVDRLRALKSLGVRLAVDDFGTGYSSLAYLRQFPVDILKIDRSFVSSMTESPEASALIHTLVQLGRDLGLETIAEGIEFPSQLARLRQEGCDTGQGFIYARPMTGPVAHAFLAERAGSPEAARVGLVSS